MEQLGVIQIIDSLHVGGAEVLAVNIANGLFEQNINSHLCATRNEGLLKENLNFGVGYIFLNRKKIIDFRAIIKLSNYIKKHNITIVHAHSTSSFIAVCVKILNPKIKIIWHDHYGFRESLSEKNMIPLKLFSLLFSAIFTVNTKLKNWSLNNLYTKKVFFIRNFPVFNNQEKITELRGKKDKRIIHLAGYRKDKDHLNLLKAFLEVSKANTNWTLHLVGKSYNDEYSNSVNDFIETNKLTDKVFQYGVCSDIQYILSQATIGVLSSKSEGLPISLLEYGLAKLPAVVTDVGECNLVVKDLRFIVPPSNSVILANAFQLLVNSKEKRKILALEINETITTKFSKEEAIFKIIEIYKNEC
ncbi:glycosyltransferase [Polaribacter gochangensis]|uniref:glycosyltransferase n=1 Tax=Polaribacter gochangensis TaxID=3252903 RepID=UPI00390474F8